MATPSSYQVRLVCLFAQKLGLSSEDGQVDEDTFRALQTVAQRHLQQYGNDEQRSLAALRSQGWNVRELEPEGVVGGATLPTREPSRVEGQRTDETLSPPEPGLHAPGRPPDRLLRSEAQYEIRDFLAAGGLGSVSLAWDVNLGRELALKEPQGNQASFLEEARITAQLQHPGIVPVYGMGRDASGKPFYTMRRIDGEDLGKLLHRFHAQTPNLDAKGRAHLQRQWLRCFLDVCNAVEYAHSQGVLHRDIKPANIVIGTFRETVLIDWGLAFRFQPRSTQNRGEMVGTPAFMSPEQIEGRTELLGPASDVFSLGATLACILTGRSPFQAETLSATVQKTLAGKPDAPSALARELHPTLEGICLKAIQHDPGQRYPSARALLDAVEQWLTDEMMAGYRDVIFEVGLDGKVLSLNPAFEVLTGWSRETIVGRSYYTLLHPEDTEQALRLYREAAVGQSLPPFRLRFATRARGYITLHCMTVLRMEKGQPVSLMGIGRVVGEQ